MDVSFWGGARWWGGWGCDYFQENEWLRGLFAGGRWQFGEATAVSVPDGRAGWAMTEKCGTEKWEGREPEVRGQDADAGGGVGRPCDNRCGREMNRREQR